MEVVEKNKSTKNTVTQSNHLLRAAYQLSLNEKRLIMLAFSKVNPKVWLQSWEITISASEWSEVYGRELKHSYGDLEQATKQIMERMLKLRSGPDVKKKNSYEMGRWVSWAKYIPGDCKVVLEIPHKLRQYLAFALLQEDGFTSYRLLDAGRLRRPNSIRLYEFCMQFEDTGFMIIGVDELRERMELEGKYSLFSDLRKWVIEPAIKDINLNTDYNAKWEIKYKKGRKATHLAFYFSVKKQRQLALGGF